MLLVLAVIFCVTIYVPFVLGRLVRRSQLLRPTGEGVFRTDLRDAGGYFLADWSAGCVVVLLLASSLVLLRRPWRGRLSRVLLAMAIAVLCIGVLAPYTARQWSDQEAITASRLRSTEYPRGSAPGVCGRASIPIGQSLVDPGSPDTTYTLFVTDSNTRTAGCDQVELWAGWTKRKTVPLKKKAIVKPGAKGAVTVSKKPWSIASSSFVVTVSSGKKQRFRLADLIGR